MLQPVILIIFNMLSRPIAMEASVSPGTVKFGVAVQQGPLEQVALTRMRVDPDSTLAHLYAEVRDCTAADACENISRMEGYTSYDMAKKVQLPLADLDDTVASQLEDGIRCVKYFEVSDMTELDGSNGERSFDIALTIITVAGSRQVVDAAALLRAAASRVFYPEAYDLTQKNQRALHSIANNIMDGMKVHPGAVWLCSYVHCQANPGEYGGWGDPASAKHARGMLKDLAAILYNVVPHASAFKQRGSTLPAVLVKFAEPVTSMRAPSDVPNKFTQEMAAAVG